jgi:hypothetical protein
MQRPLSFGVPLVPEFDELASGQCSPTRIPSCLKPSTNTQRNTLWPVRAPSSVKRWPMCWESRSDRNDWYAAQTSWRLLIRRPVRFFRSMLTRQRSGRAARCRSILTDAPRRQAAALNKSGSKLPHSIEPLGAASVAGENRSERWRSRAGKIMRPETGGLARNSWRLEPRLQTVSEKGSRPRSGTQGSRPRRRVRLAPEAGSQNHRCATRSRIPHRQPSPGCVLHSGSRACGDLAVTTRA